MDSPFVFSSEAVNDAFVGRQNELSWLVSNLCNREHTVLIAPPGYGKKSLVQKAFAQAQKQAELKLCACNLFNVRDEYAFYSQLAHQLFGIACATGDGWAALAEQLLPLTRPEIAVDERGKPHTVRMIFDRQRLQEHAHELLQLPERIAVQQNVSLIVWINEFQEIADFDRAGSFQKRLLVQWKLQSRVGYLLSGSKVNAMHKLLAEKQSFYKFGKYLPLEPLNQKQFADYVVKSFSKSGRVIDRELGEAICEAAQGYPLYAQQLAHWSWVATKGFANEATLDVAKKELLNTNERLFRVLVDNLSTPQINYLRAIIDGVERFSSSETLTKYDLHSSANILRVRSALEKKEIIRIVRHKPQFIDPVFELWLQKRYFGE